MRSPVGYAVLGLVIEQPSYGYELLQRLRSRYGELLEISSPSHVYAALDRLQREGLIAHAADERARGGGSPRRSKVIYRATDDGARAHRQWLAGQLRDEERHVELLGRLIAAGTEGPDALADLLDRCERACAEAEQRLAQEHEAAADGGAESHGAFVARLVVAERRFALEAQRRWIASARAELRARIDGAGDGARAQPRDPGR